MPSPLTPSPSTLFAITWGIWAASWIVAAVWTAPNVAWRWSGEAALAYALIIASIIIPVAWTLTGWPLTHWWFVGYGGAQALALATIPGFVFAWWARLYLGRLWSAAIVAKADHRIVQSGPYALVRHPIYTGILWAAAVTDIAGANAVSAMSFGCLLSGFCLKARLEELFLQEVLPAKDYAAYRRRVPMLIPYRLT